MAGFRPPARPRGTLGSPTGKPEEKPNACALSADTAASELAPDRCEHEFKMPVYSSEH